jgi:phytoene dehydrogenase-like protein
MEYDVVIVGSGMSGLTAAAYLVKSGMNVLLCEKEKKVGGLVGSFDFNGFTFDSGIRAIENSGIVRPMLRQLGINVEFVRNPVSIGIENEVVNLSSKDSLSDYLRMLGHQFPGRGSEIERIGGEIRRIMHYMDVMYGIDNPLFMDMMKDKEYLYGTILPWSMKFLLTIGKIKKLNKPVVEYLRKFTDDMVLIDMIAQHFFRNTPTFFALSYFSLYLDYQYPKGGTGALTSKMERFILDNHGEIRTSTEIRTIDPGAHKAVDANGDVIAYKKLIWAADLRKLYSIVNADAIAGKKEKHAFIAQQEAVSDKIGGDSVLTLYLTADLNKSHFAAISNAHFFYTPRKIGLTAVCPETPDVFTADKSVVLDWLMKYFQHTTYEISIPVLRDETLAPEGQTGLIVSTLFDYKLTKDIAAAGWYEEFKEFSNKCITNSLMASIYPDLRNKIIDSFVSTPLTIEKINGSSEGAITGWSFTNSSIPVVSDMTKVAASVLTPIPDVLQAGQWSYSPSGLPIAIMTGKLAADKVTGKKTFGR